MVEENSELVCKTQLKSIVAPKKHKQIKAAASLNDYRIVIDLFAPVLLDIFCS
jgi:hypothetical protein